MIVSTPPPTCTQAKMNPDQPSCRKASLNFIWRIIYFKRKKTKWLFLRLLENCDLPQQHLLPYFCLRNSPFILYRRGQNKKKKCSHMLTYYTQHGYIMDVDVISWILFRREDWISILCRLLAQVMLATKWAKNLCVMSDHGLNCLNCHFHCFPAIPHD